MRIALTGSANTRSSTKHTSSTASRSFNPHMDGGDFTGFKGKQQSGMMIDEDSRSPVTITSPACFVMKVEYGILDVMTEMIDLAKMYDRQYTAPVVPGESNHEEDDVVNIEFLSSPLNNAFVNTNDQGVGTLGGINDKGLKLTIDTSLTQHNDEIKDKIYAGLVKVYDIVTQTNSDLDQYILRELRYLQEFLTHGYPEIARYIKVPLEEVITTVKAKTKGFTNNNRRGSSPIPMDAANGAKSPPLSPPAKKCKTDDELYDKNGKKTKKSTTEKVKDAVRGDSKNNKQKIASDASDETLYNEVNKMIQEPYGFFIDVGNEGDEGFFFD